MAVSDLGCALPVGLEDLNKLNPCAVVFRYDDKEIELVDRVELVEMVGEVRHWVLGLFANPSVTPE